MGVYLFKRNMLSALSQNGRGLLCATAVAGGGTDTEWEPAQKVNSGEENSPAASAGTRARNLSITSPALYQHTMLAEQTESLIALYSQQRWPLFLRLPIRTRWRERKKKNTLFWPPLLPDRSESFPVGDASVTRVVNWWFTRVVNWWLTRVVNWWYMSEGERHSQYVSAAILCQR